MIMIKKFLFSLVVVLTTFLFATSANAREIASITRTPVMEIPAITANPTSPKQVYVRETLVIIYRWIYGHLLRESRNYN